MPTKCETASLTAAPRDGGYHDHNADQLSHSPFLSAASWTPISNRQPRPQHGPQFAGVGNSNGLVDRIFDIRGCPAPSRAPSYSCPCDATAVHLAGLRREHARAALDDRPLAGRRRRGRVADRASPGAGRDRHERPGGGRAHLEEMLSVSKDDWRREAEGIGEFFAKFDGRLPAEMERQRQGLVRRLG